MSDSDETVCEDDCENTENSPSILSNWNEDEEVCSMQAFSAQKEESRQKQLAENNSDGKENNQKIDLSISYKKKSLIGFVENGLTQSLEGSPEFPLTSRGLKRKSPESTTANEDEKRLQNLLKTVEEFVEDMEIASERRGESSQHLDIDTKRQIVDLAKNQRDLLDAFKKYKNLVQRLKVIKDLSGTPQNSQNLSRSKSRGTVSIITTSSALQTMESSDSMQVAAQISQNLPNTTPTIVSTTTVTSGLSKAIQQGPEKIILLQNQPQSSHKVLPQIQHDRLNTTSSSRQSTISESTTEAGSKNVTASFERGVNTTTAKKINAAHVEAHNKALRPTTYKKITANTTKSSTIPSRINSNIPSTHPISKNQNLETANRSQKRFQTPIDLSGINHSSIATNPLLLQRQTHTPSSNQVITISSSSQSTFGSTKGFGMNPNSTLASTVFRLSSQSDTQGNRPMGQDALIGNQFNTRPQATVVKQASALSLNTLLKEGVITPGKNVLTATSEGKLFSASLSDKGTIVSAGGEGFTSPRSWMKAISGSKRKVKNEQAWRMVSYKNKPLLDHVNRLTLESDKTTQAATAKVNFAGSIQGPDQTKAARNTTKRDRINNVETLKTFLRNCRVIGISKEEILPSEKLRRDFWDKSDAECLNEHVLKILDF